MEITVNSMVLFSCRLVGCTPAEWACASVVLVWEISGESPFSSRACRHGKLGSRLNRTGRFPVVGLPAAPLSTAPLPSPLDCKVNALLSPPTSPPLFPPLSLVPEPCNWLNFSMHSSIRAGGAFLWATLTRPQNSTSNFLAKAVGDMAEEGATQVVFAGREEKHVWEGSLPPVEVLLEMLVMSSLRAQLLPACLNVLMISGTWRDSKQEIRTCNYCNRIFCNCMTINFKRPTYSYTNEHDYIHLSRKKDKHFTQNILLTSGLKAHDTTMKLHQMQHPIYLPDQQRECIQIHQCSQMDCVYSNMTDMKRHT